MTLGAKIKKLRIDKDITQKQLADQIHVSFQTVSKWENNENEPDVSTLRELSRLFNCSLDYLLSEDESENKTKESEAPESKTIIIHQNELHVCERCKKDIPEDELEIENVMVRHSSRGHSAQYRQAFYHKSCLSEIRAERAKTVTLKKQAFCEKGKKASFGWGIAAGCVALLVTLLLMLLTPEGQEAIKPGFAVLYSVLVGYGIFAMIYCIISGSYIGDVFVWCAKLTVRFPGLIFTWDLDGIVWLIFMKILFAILGFIIGVFALVFAILLSASLGAVSFPFVLIHNNRTGYEDSLVGGI